MLFTGCTVHLDIIAQLMMTTVAQRGCRADILLEIKYMKLVYNTRTTQSTVGLTDACVHTVQHINHQATLPPTHAQKHLSVTIWFYLSLQKCSKMFLRWWMWMFYSTKTGPKVFLQLYLC